MLRQDRFMYGPWLGQKVPLTEEIATLVWEWDELIFICVGINPWNPNQPLYLSILKKKKGCVDCFPFFLFV